MSGNRPPLPIFLTPVAPPVSNGQISGGSGGGSGSISFQEEDTDLVFPENALGYLFNDGEGNLSWDNIDTTSSQSFAVNSREVDLTGESSYNILLTDEIVIFNDSDLTAKDIFLPLLSTITESKIFIIIKNCDNELRIKSSGSDTIEGTNMIVFTERFDRTKLFSTTYGWFTI
jgi:hypothetical protein